jgi:hypothetical protein
VSSSRLEATRTRTRTHAHADKLDDLDRQIDAMKAAALAEKHKRGGGGGGAKASDGLAAHAATVQAKLTEMEQQRRDTDAQV